MYSVLFVGLGGVYNCNESSNKALHYYREFVAWSALFFDL